MGVDQPGDAEMPPDEQPDRPPDQSGDGSRPAGPGGTEAETRYRHEYYADLRVAVTAEESVTARRIAAGEQAAAETWQQKSAESRWMWTEYQRKWPPKNARLSTGPPIRRVPGAETATGSWTAAIAARLKEHATVSPSASETRSPQPCAPQKAKVLIGT